MRVRWIAFVGCLLATTAMSQRGMLVKEGPGHLTAGDFNDDGYDDVLLLGVYGTSGTYLGTGQQTHFSRGGPWTFDDYWSLCDAPVFVGGYLYVPRVGSGNGVVDIRVYRYDQNVWSLRRTITLMPTSPSRYITSIRITALHKDVDGDKRADLFAVWNEIPSGTTGNFFAAYLSPMGPIGGTPIPIVRGQPQDAVIVDVHRAAPMTRTKTPEYLVTMSAQANDRLGGFGFATLTDGPKMGAGIWASGGPPLNYAIYQLGESPVSYGEFNIVPAMKTPLVHLSTGRSVLFLPWVSAPYINNRAEFLYTTRESLTLNQCLTDFDGDGRDEIVLLEQFGNSPHHNLLYVGDPSSNRNYSQFFSLIDYKSPGSSLTALHGATGDFDGDGDPDLVLSLKHMESSGVRGYFALFLCDRSNGPGRPALTRLY